MNIIELQEYLQETLEPILNDSGSLIFSSKETITKGDLYTLGLNPGGEVNIPIKRVLKELPSKISNSYLDENWGNRSNPSYKIGQHPLQKNFVGLINGIGYDPASVFSSNLIFTRSRNQSGAHFSTRADLCWKAHQEFIRIVDPDVFIVFGNSKISPYQYILNKYPLSVPDTIESGHGTWKCYYAKGNIEGRERHLIGVPHLSRYYIIYHQDVIDWIKSKIQ